MMDMNATTVTSQWNQALAAHRVAGETISANRSFGFLFGEYTTRTTAPVG
jgi:hypothetical protein